MQLLDFWGQKSPDITKLIISIFHIFLQTASFPLYFLQKKSILPCDFLFLPMNELSSKGLIILFLCIVGIYFAIPWNAYHVSENLQTYLPPDYRFGLDLQGGVELDYKVDLDVVRKDKDHSGLKEDSILEGLKAIIDKRVEALKINDSVITTASYGSEKHIIVQIPLKWEDSDENQRNIQRAKEAIGKVMRIEFRERRGNPTEEDFEARHQLALELFEEAKNSEYDFSVTQTKYTDSYENISTGTHSGTLDELSAYFSVDEENITLWEYYPEVLTGKNFPTLTQDAFGNLAFNEDEWFFIVRFDEKNTVTKTVPVEKIEEEPENTDIGPTPENTNDEVQEPENEEREVTEYSFSYAFVSALPSEWKPAIDSKGRILNDRFFLNSSVQYNDLAQPMIELTFNDEWADIFYELTSRLVGQQIAIFVGGENLTSPNVNQAISGGKATITGNFTPKEAKELSQNINTGVVPAPIYLTSERTIDSRLGANSLQQLIVAWVAGFAVIFVFLVLVYRVAGFFAGVTLFLYVVLLLALVKIFGVVLTLASIAGLILSVGMAIDANILIFERVKDAIKRGGKLEDAVQEGFEKSWSAIWDSNLTGILIAVILFVFGINMIKGFGLMLGIGLVLSLFSAMYVSRYFILLMIRRKDLDLGTFIGIRK